MFDGVIVDNEIEGVGDKREVKCSPVVSSECGGHGGRSAAFPVRVILSTVAGGGMHTFLATAICSAVGGRLAVAAAEGRRQWQFHTIFTFCKISTPPVAAAMLQHAFSVPTAPADDLVSSCVILAAEYLRGAPGRLPFHIFSNAPNHHGYMHRLRLVDVHETDCILQPATACLQPVTAAIRGVGIFKKCEKA